MVKPASGRPLRNRFPLRERSTLHRRHAV